MPRLGGRPVNRIHTADVMAVLLPIWNEKRETEKRVRRRISAVMRWAVAQGYREDNPAGEAIGAALPRNGVRPRHHPALPYAKVGGAIEAVRMSGAYPATVRAFEFLVLTACRSGEVRGALWKEMDLEEREWRIPPERMKTGREHRVPLSSGALAVLQEAQALADGSGGSLRRGAARCPRWRSRRWSGTSGSGRCPTGSVRASGTGRRSARTRRGRCASWRWRT